MNEPTYRQRLRDDVVAIATSLVQQDGLDALQARRIAKAAGCSVGSIYNVFGDIDDLIATINGLTLRRLGIQLSAALDGQVAGSFRDRLLALALAYARFALDNPRAWDAIFKHRRSSGRAVPQGYIDEQMRLIRILEDVIAEWKVDQGERSLSARALFAAVHGIVALAMDDRLGGTARLELESQIRFIVDVITAGRVSGRV